MPARQARSRLIIVCGLPGSGKTTHATQLASKLQAVRFCPDEWMLSLKIDLYDSAARARIETLQWKFAQELLALGLVVIIEWGTWGKSERDALRIGARALGAAVELHFLDVPVELLFERIQQRNMESPPITRADLLTWTNIFQVPSAEELALFDKPARDS
jgi:predicted kinase